MGKMGFHFQRLSHGAHRLCHHSNKWSGWKKCASKGHCGTQESPGNMNHGSCNGHHHHHFGKWSAMALKRKFHRSHCGHMKHSHSQERCASKGHCGTQETPGNINHGSCNGHHHHHQHHFGKRSNMALKRQFHHSHRGHMNHFHSQKDTHHHCHQHGHERFSQHEMDREPMRNRNEHCTCDSQSKACQTEPVVEEATECSHSQNTETEGNQAST